MVDRIINPLARSKNSMFNMDIEEVIGSLDGIRTTYKDKSLSLLEDVQDLRFGPRGLSRLEDQFLELTLLEEHLTRLLLNYNYKDL